MYNTTRTSFQPELLDSVFNRVPRASRDMASQTDLEDIVWHQYTPTSVRTGPTSSKYESAAVPFSIRLQHLCSSTFQCSFPVNL
ncbi:hypothetical protein SCLCIDRAFT_1100862 [Scleroderma citrinum Foug A]|uniref:Uncharacterized protein n=1 Tax=Scleroderma citrinum Foug A TaxID=1036808 RepID=A0A0C2Z884_9AGAM|nr:hypothetical protein SCLCIDRAFT_1100862 [Scleroderma citrinum Foug A]